MLENSFGKRPEEPITPESQEGEENLADLERQEQLDAECAEEAKKLGQNIEDLKNEIDAFGGAEKFKEVFEQPIYADGSGTKAGKVLRDFEDKKDLKSSHARFNRNVSLLMGGIIALEAYALEGETVSDKLAEIKQMWESSQIHPVMGHQHGKVDVVVNSMIITLFASVGALALVQSIKDRFEVRRLEKQKKIETLKFKMTGTEVK